MFDRLTNGKNLLQFFYPVFLVLLKILRVVVVRRRDFAITLQISPNVHSHIQPHQVR